MARFLIEVPHEAEKLACLRSIQVFLSSGSHFLTHADWGCMDGDHRSWLIVEVADKAEARAIVPPALRASAKVIALNSFSIETIEQILKDHSSAAS